MTVAGSRLNQDQENVVMHFVDAIPQNKQELIFLHSGGGTGKSTVVRALNRVINALGFVQANSCPTGVGATYLDKGKTFHSLFRAYTEDLNASTTIDEIRKELGGDKLRLVVIDEVSMLKALFLLLLHRWLCSMYSPTKPFGGISILLLGDFLQLPTVGGNPLYRVMYDNVSQDDVQVHALFRQFRVIEMKQQHCAGQCEIQKKRLQSFRALPQTYPKFGSRWCEEDMQKFRPMTEDIVEGLTTELTRAEIMADWQWTTNATCLTTTNLDRSVINNTIANIYGIRKRQTVVRWRRQFRKVFDPSVKDFLTTFLYSEDRYPELFSYFVFDAPGQILDNGNGNVSYGVANGTACKLIGLGWDDPKIEKAMHDLISQQCALWSIGEQCIIDIPSPPDCIVVEVKIANIKKWPLHLNLSKQPNKTVWIPIGIKSNNRGGGIDKDCITLPNNEKLSYRAHAVDLSFAVTIWKSQGGTFDRIISLLESYDTTKKQRLTYELMYVTFSRVRNASGFRCMPLLTSIETKQRLRRLRPSIYATRYRMDINDEGYWDAANATTKKVNQPKS